MSNRLRIVLILAIVLAPALFLRPLAYAWEGRAEETLLFQEGEVIEDDLYAAADTIRINGVIRGDLVAVAETLFINGTVEGDVIVAGESVVINGAINDDVRMAGLVIQIGEGAQIADDLFAAGASLETLPNSRILGDVVLGSGQALLAGDLAGTLHAATSALELRGRVDGDVYAWVDVAADSERFIPVETYISDSAVAIPSVPGGLTVSPQARIGGNLTYSGTVDVPIPNGVVGGTVQRIEPLDEPEPVPANTPAQRVIDWALDALRQAATLILLGALLAWRLPNLLSAPAEILRNRPWSSLGWGALAYPVVLFALFLIGAITLFASLIFGVLTLSGLSTAVAFFGLSLLALLITVFVIVVSYGTKIIVGQALGSWLLQGFNSPWAGHRFWPMIVGVIVLVIVLALLRFPLIPIGLLGWLINLGVILFGLGAFWLWGKERQAPAQVG